MERQDSCYRHIIEGKKIKTLYFLYYHCFIRTFTMLIYSYMTPKCLFKVFVVYIAVIQRRNYKLNMIITWSNSTFQFIRLQSNSQSIRPLFCYYFASTEVQFGRFITPLLIHKQQTNNQLAKHSFLWIEPVNQYYGTYYVCCLVLLIFLSKVMF